MSGFRFCGIIELLSLVSDVFEMSTAPILLFILMETYTAATLRPIVARAFIEAQNYTMPAEEVRRRMQLRMTLTDLDREISTANIERWWQRTLDVVQSLRQRGYMLPDDPSRRFVWTLTNPAGVEWARNAAALKSCLPPKAIATA